VALCEFFFEVLGMKPNASHMLGKCYHLSYVPKPFKKNLIFKAGSHYLYPSWPQIPNPSASISQIAGITGVYYYACLALCEFY
jgi:hypothetical protein